MFETRLGRRYLLVSRSLSDLLEFVPAHDLANLTSMLVFRPYLQYTDTRRYEANEFVWGGVGIVRHYFARSANSSKYHYFQFESSHTTMFAQFLRVRSFPAKYRRNDYVYSNLVFVDGGSLYTIIHILLSRSVPSFPICSFTEQ